MTPFDRTQEVSFLRALADLDPARMGVAFDGAFDKCTSFEETGVMVDQLANQFPGLVELVNRLQIRVIEELDDESAQTHAVLGGAMVLLALIDYATTQELRTRFPDLPETP